VRACALTVLLLGWAATRPLGAVTLTVGTNINITKSIANNAEETIAINPLNPNNLFADDTWTTIGRYTTNGGVTWQDSNLSALGQSIGDVSAAWDTFGNLFLIQFNNSGAAVVGLSTNGGASFKLLYTSTAAGDQPTVVVGPGNAPGKGSVWLFFADLSTRPTVQGAIVNGLGAVGSFSAPQNAPGPGGNFGDIAIGPNGEVLVAYQDSGSGEGPDAIKLNLDPDGLGSAGFSPVLTNIPINVGGFAYIPAQPNRSIDSEIGLAWDRSGGPHNGRVYLMFTDRPSITSDDTDIYVQYSDNKGTNWSPRLRVNDDPVGNGKSQLLPKIALDQTTGNIAVMFYDCRNSSANTLAEVWASVSTDSGVTFSPNVKVSAGKSNANVPDAQGFDFGDYTGLAFNAGVFYPCWADNSNSTGDNPAGVYHALDMYTARVTVSSAPVIAGIQPTNLTVLQNQTAAFTVTASGAQLSYLWFKDGQLLSGATASTYSLASAQPANSGNYVAVVTNSFGTATSGVATLSVIPTVPLPVALDNTALTWTTPSGTPWFGQTNIFHPSGANAAAARSYFIGDSQQTVLATTATGPGTLTFWWKVSSQTNADFLTFLATGGGVTNTAQISGEVDWTQQTFFLPAGAQTLTWTYSKDASLSAGSDAGYLDQVAFAAGGTQPYIITQPANQSGAAARPVTFTVSAGGTPVLSYQWRLNANPLAGSTSTSLTITNPIASDGGNYSVLVSNLYGTALSANALLSIVPLGVAGDNSFGQLNVPGLATNAIAIAAGAWHSLALRADGTVLAWGDDFDGQSDVPAGLANVVGIAGGGYHSLALKADGSVAAWGANYNGQTTLPVGLSNIIAIAAGTWHSLALRADGTVVAWGDDTFGQAEVPADLATVVAIAAAGNHNLALRSDGTVVAWGENTDASGSFVGQSTVPGNLANVVAIGAGDYHSLAALADGTVVAWGANSDGQCQVPPALTNVVALAGGGAHTLALKADSSIAGWGNNYNGQLGFPASVSSVLQVAAGDSHSLLLVGNPAALSLLRPAHRGNQFTALVQTVAGKHYTLEATSSLSPATWTPVATVRGNGALQFLTDLSAVQAGKFYRVREW
jgi:hypothetical protein